MTNIAVSPTAKDAVRQDFNPSQDPTVADLKRRTAELISLMELIRDRGVAGREASVAITQLQTASMWCVLAATKGLPGSTRPTDTTDSGVEQPGSSSGS